MIRTGLRQKHRGSSPVCLLCRHKLLLGPTPRSSSWTPNRSLASRSAAPSALGLHATPSVASNHSGPSPGAPRGWGASGGGGGWGAGGSGWGTGLKKDPELEARKARDREAREAEERDAREAKEREEREAREAIEREVRERQAREREAREREEEEKRAHLLRNQQRVMRPRRPLPLGVEATRAPPPVSRPFGRQPAGSELLPWKTDRPQERDSRYNQRESSSFWNEAELRAKDSAQERTPESLDIRDTGRLENSRSGTEVMFRRVQAPETGQLFRRIGGVDAVNRPNPPLPQETKTTEELGKEVPVYKGTAAQDWTAEDHKEDDSLESIIAKAAPKETRPKSSLTDSAWDWTEEHLKAAASPRPEQRILVSLEPVIQPGGAFGDQMGVREGRYDRSSRLEREERPKKGRPQRRESAGDEDEFDLDSAKERRRRKAERKAEKERARLAALEEAGPIPILLPEFISVSNLAVALGVKPNVFLNQMMELGFEDISIDNILTGETAAIVAEEYGFDPTIEAGEGRDLKPAPAPEDPSLLPSRPPVVTIMGHVDHGKTTLLDYLRKSSIAAGEHGGITQHIGAFSVKLTSGKPITFLDTPGHAAFVQMRQRGANVTDIAILVVAADDSVKPQTIEALKHARAAKVPIIVAITKVDKPDANVDRVKSDLAAQGVEIEDYGGDVQVVSVSGKTGQGMDDLEENILLLSDILDIRSETDGMAEGWVLESSIKPIGRAATILVKRGTLRPGDFIVAGTVATRIRVLRNEAGVEVDEAPPGTAIEVLGWKDPPNAGDQVLQAPDKDKADAAVEYRLEQQEREEAISQMAEQEQQRREREREKAAAEAAEAAADGRPPRFEPEEEGTKIVNFTVKGDVHGSVEAVCQTIEEIGNNEVRPRILMSSAGQITESDVEHAAVSNSCIINFNTPVAGHIKRLADNSKVRILDHNIIYHMAEEVKDVLSELLPPKISSKVVGDAEILQVFSINTKGRVYKNVAGCRIRNGHVTNKSTCRVLRNEEEVFTGPIATLKQGKKDVTEVKKGGECGISFKDWEEFKQGDQIQVIEEVIEKRRLP